MSDHDDERQFINPNNQHYAFWRREPPHYRLAKLGGLFFCVGLVMAIDLLCKKDFFHKQDIKGDVFVAGAPIGIGLVLLMLSIFAKKIENRSDSANQQLQP